MRSFRSMRESGNQMSDDFILYPFFGVVVLVLLIVILTLRKSLLQHVHDYSESYEVSQKDGNTYREWECRECGHVEREWLGWDLPRRRREEEDPSDWWKDPPQRN